METVGILIALGGMIVFGVYLYAFIKPSFLKKKDGAIPTRWSIATTGVSISLVLIIIGGLLNPTRKQDEASVVVQNPRERCAEAMAAISKADVDRECGPLNSEEVYAAREMALQMNPNATVIINDSGNEETANNTSQDSPRMENTGTDGAIESQADQPEKSKSLWSETMKAGYPLCLTEDLFDEMVQALARGDDNQFDYLSGNGCVITKSGLKFSVIDTSWGTAKVRVYLPGKKTDSIVGWTNIEAVKN